MLLEQPELANSPDTTLGDTALFRVQSESMVELLASFDANFNFSDPEGHTPVFFSTKVIITLISLINLV